MGNVIVLTVLAVALVLAGRSIYKSHKSGSCCGGCNGCSGCSGHCHSQPPQ